MYQHVNARAKRAEILFLLIKPIVSGGVLVAVAVVLA